jgi:putative endonuclease
MVRCADGSLYTGIATDIGRRVAEHNDSDRLAAKYTRGRRPVVLVYEERCVSRTEAARRESAIKRLERCDKLALIQRESL